jgi:hypothetical protein
LLDLDRDARLVHLQAVAHAPNDQQLDLVSAGVGGELQDAPRRGRPLHVLGGVDPPQERGLGVNALGAEADQGVGLVLRLARDAERVRPRRGGGEGQNQ